MGGSKTCTLANEAIQLALRYAGNQIFVGRLHADDLNNNTLKEIIEWLPPQFKQEEWSYSPYYRQLLFKRTGSIVFFDHLEDWRTLKGPEYGAVMIDEADEVPVESAQILLTRLRLTDEKRLTNIREAKLTPQQAGYKPGEEIDAKTGKPHIPYYFCAGFNPMPGHWVEHWFLKDADLVEIDGHICYVKSDQFLFVPALLGDNPHYPQASIDIQVQQMPEDWQKRFILGQWILFGADAVFPEFDTMVHTIEPFDIPSDWPRFRAIDHGASQSSGTACLWGAVNPSRTHLFIYDEYLQYSDNLINNTNAISEKYPDETYMATFIDPSTRKGSANDIPLIKQYARQGLRSIPAGNNIDASVALIRSLLKVDPALEHPITGVLGSPRMFFFKRRCPFLSQRILSVHWVKSPNGETRRDLPRRDSDLIDAWRYLVMGVGLGIRRERPKGSYEIVRPHA